MSERSKQLTQLRPAIPVVHSHQTGGVERFQNNTLRPILKFQNPLLLQLFRHYVFQRKGTFWQLSAKEQLTYIDQAVRKDLRFKAQLLGVVMGLFTEAEYEAFIGHESELRRRCTDLLVQRLQSQLEQLQKDADQ